MAFELTDKKKRALIVIGAISGITVILVAILYLALYGGKGKPKEGESDIVPQNVLSEVPEADVADNAKSKMTIYRSQKENATINDYWDDLGGEGDSPSDDLYAEPETKSPSGGRPKTSPTSDVSTPGKVTMDDLYGPSQSVQSAQSSGTSEAQRRYDERMRRSDEAAARAERDRKEMRDLLLAKQAEAEAAQDGSAGGQQEAEEATEPVEEPKENRIEVEQVQVRRTGSVSTLDDGFVSAGSSGISSLSASDDIYSADEEYPFKCMFVRDEKIRNGARVPIRLLEDMVIDGQLVPKNTHLQAICSIGKRLELNVSTLEVRGRIINFDYDAYDNDGGKGLYFPEVNDEKTKQAKDQVTSTVLSRAASSAGRLAQDAINVGRIFVQGTGREATVSVPAGYQFFLVKKTNR